MKVAYYEENNFHTEIIGTFLNFFSDNNIKITIFNSSDWSSTIDYFRKISYFDLKPHTELVNNYHIYDKIIIGTAGSTKDFLEKIIDIDYDKLIFICHSSKDILPTYRHVLVLTPLNIVDTNNLNIGYILPIHNYYSEILANKKNILTVIGRFKETNRDTNDLIKVITQYHWLDFKVELFARAKKFVPRSLFNLSNKYKNKLKVFLNYDTFEMEKHLKESKFILPLVGKDSWYYRDRLSGCIALAYNYNIPLVIDEKLRSIYQIEKCISYDNSICEVIEKIVNMEEKIYQQLVAGVMEMKNKILEQNNEVLRKMFGL